MPALPHLSLSLQFGDLSQAEVHRTALPRHRVQRAIRHALEAGAEITVRIVDEEKAAPSTGTTAARTTRPMC
jgi:probable rRNA maturation factor